MKKIIFIALSLLLLSCSNKEHNKITIQNNDTTKFVSVEMHSIDILSFEVEKQISDLVILENIRIYTDSIKADNKRRDSLHHINFLKLTKKINGGYNGLDDRLRLWENAKKVLND